MPKTFFKIAFFITAGTIFIMALMQNQSISIDFRHGDKVGHFLAFFTLSLLLNRSSSSYTKRVRNVLVLLLFGIFIEFAQSFTGYRSASFYDVIADLMGILVFQAFFSIYKYFKYKKNSLSF